VRKSFPITGFKALDAAQGQFEAIVSVFGNVDLGGDRVVKGAFTKSLAEWQAKQANGRPIPVIFSHQWENLDAHIGEVLAAEERDEGLYVKAQLEMDEPFAARVFKKLQKGTIAEFSFAYDVRDSKRQNGANELLDLDLIEVGPTLKGMNPATDLLGVKARDGKVRRKQAVVGSFEDVRERVSRALRAQYDSPDVWVWVVATFDGRAVFEIEDMEAGTGETREVDFTLGANGTVALGDERAVTLQTVVTPKGRGSKEGRRNAAKDAERLQAVHDLMLELGATCPASEDDAKASERRAAKDEEPRGAKSQELRAGPLAARIAAELVELGAG
jgi:HK97 family phage prohead protease